MTHGKRGARLLLLACAGMVIGFGLWAAIGRLDIVSVATGRVVPASRVQEIAHLEGGIVADIRVAEGNRVTHGQPLVILEPTKSDADLARMQARLDGHRIAIARLGAEAAWAEGPIFDPDLRARRGDLVDKAVNLFAIRRERVENELKAQRQAIEQRDYEMREVSARLDGNRRGLDLVEEQMTISRKLLKLDLTNRMKHLDLAREATALRSRIAEDEALIVRTRAALNEAKSRLAAIRAGFVEAARDRLQDEEKAVSELTEALRTLRDSLERTVLRAPADGIVKTLHVRTVGGVVRPGGRVADIVPVDDRLVIEAQLPNSDVGYVQPGQAVQVRLASSDAMRFGSLAGRVAQVSPDADVTEDGVPFYLVRIETEGGHFQAADLRHDLVPGMRVQCGIRIGTRSVYEYLLQPFLGSLGLALRER